MRTSTLRHLPFPALRHDGGTTVEDASDVCLRHCRLFHRGEGLLPAAVFDIDSTLLLGAALNPEIVRVFRSLLSAGVVCFLVTARPEVGREETEKQLRDLGVEGHSALFMRRGARFRAKDIGREKQEARDAVSDAGHVILVNFGDAWTDHYPVEELKRSRIAETLGNRAPVTFVDPVDCCLHCKLAGEG